MKDKREEQDVEVVMDNKEEPLVLWYPETKELEVRVEKALDNSGYQPKDIEAFDRLKTKVHDTIREAFETGKISTLVEARIKMLECVLKAAKRGDLINTDSQIKEMLEKRTLN